MSDTAPWGGRPIHARESATDAWQFGRNRRSYYEYLAALLQGTAGARTLKQIFAADARRYGPQSARGRLSRRWLELFQAAGGDLYATWFGTFPVNELAILRGAQSQGNDTLVATLVELSRVLGVIDTARNILRTSLLTAVLALAIVTATVLLVPAFTVPRLREAFGAIPVEYHGGAASSLFRFADVIAQLWPIALLCSVLIACLVPISFARYVGWGRSWLDRIGPWRVYRQVHALRFLAMLAVALGKGEHGATRLRQGLELQLAGATPWLAAHVLRMVHHVDSGRQGVAIFDTGLMDPSQLWFLDDMVAARGLTPGLRACSDWVERHVLGVVARQAAAMRWCLLLAALSGVLSIALWHFAAIDDMRRALALYQAGQ